MNDKQQIKEIAKVLEDRIINKTWRAEKVAKELYEMIIPKDSVVLSMGEYEALKKQIEYWEHETKVAREDIYQSSKETAEKILRDFKLWAREYQYKDTIIDDKGERPMTSNEKLNYLYTYLCDKYNVEIGE